MEKVLIIDSCYECKHCKTNDHSDECGHATMDGKTLRDVHGIPDWCPLSNYIPHEIKAKPKRTSFNPHWVGDTCCRDYQIGNITIIDVPDKYVFRVTKFRGGYGFAQGNVDEFLESVAINARLVD